MEKRKRPRALTLTLPNTSHPYLLLDGKKHALRNFSQEGIGLWLTPPVPFGLTPGSRLNGDLVIGKDIFAVQLEVVHQSTKVIGLKILHKSEQLSALFHSLLLPSNYACNMSVHRKSGDEDPQSGFCRLWLEGESSELLVWYNGSIRMITALQLFWIGRLIYRQFQHPALTGLIKDDNHRVPGSVFLETDFIMRHPVADRELIQQAALFLTSIPAPMPGHLFWQFLETGEQVYLPASLFEGQQVA